MEESLSNDIKLLVLQWVDFYSKVVPEKLEKIKREVKMNISSAATITEYYELKGREQGIIEGEKRGMITGKIEALENLYKLGMLSKLQYYEMIAPLKSELTEFNSKLN